ncbi:MAG: type IV pilus secretin PilQ [Gammaproteobacteria bacterium]|nr:type IV pilus secretin PilQ [Gammaproteobacteria bacterium]
MSDRLQTSKVTLFKSFRQNGRRACHNLFAAACLLLGSTVAAQAADTASGNTLQSVDVAGLPGNKAQITLTLSNPAPAPLSFTIDNPARIALDFPNTSNGLAQRSQEIGIGMAESLTAVEAQGRTRVAVNQVNMVPYEAHAEGNKIILTVQNAGSQMSEAAVAAARASGDGDESINNIDFRRGEDGQGRVIVSLSDPSVPVDMQQQGGKVLVDFYRTQLPEELERRLDVLDFATPVKTIDTYTRGDNVHMVITPMGEYEYIAYQTDNQFTIEVRELTREEVEEAKKDEFGFSGERLSLNFQDIEVRSVLQLIADFTGLNVVVSDTVRGSLTLRLKNVPWDQALDIILKTKGLGMRQTGNVMLVAPSEEIAAREKLELESKKQIEELEPLYSEYIQVNYAKASDLATLLKSSDTTLMSDRGMVTTDKRTNTLLVQDTAAKLVEVRQLVARLDIPVRQVLIESRIVIANNDFSKELGVKFGLNKQTEFNGGNNIVSVGGTRPGDPRTGGGGVIDPDFTNPESSADNLLVDLGVVGASSSIGMAIGKIGSYMLNLELSAMEAEGQGEIISSPRVLTSNQKAAFIESGTEIPYQEATSSGATSTEFQKAVLSLSVTPQITPDDRLIMDLQISKDSVGEFSVDGIPSIDTNEVSTQVLVDDGETLVLGGIYEQIKRNEVDRTPFFGELPLVDWMFKKTLSQDDRAELLIFVTPKIVKEELNI